MMPFQREVLPPQVLRHGIDAQSTLQQDSGRLNGSTSKRVAVVLVSKKFVRCRFDPEWDMARVYLQGLSVNGRHAVVGMARFGKLGMLQMESHISSKFAEGSDEEKVNVLDNVNIANGQL
jgi:hypothetical protein